MTRAVTKAARRPRAASRDRPPGRWGTRRAGRTAFLRTGNRSSATGGGRRRRRSGCCRRIGCCPTSGWCRAAPGGLSDRRLSTWAWRWARSAGAGRLALGGMLHVRLAGRLAGRVALRLALRGTLDTLGPVRRRRPAGGWPRGPIPAPTRPPAAARRASISCCRSTCRRSSWASCWTD